MASSPVSDASRDVARVGVTDLADASPDDLLGRAWAIRRLLDDADAEDHALRIRLVASLDVVRLHAAQQWHANGWRPITDTEVPPRTTPSLLVAPALAGGIAAIVATRALGMADWVAVLLTALCAAPLVAQRLGGGAGVVRRVTRVGAVVLWAQLALDTTLASMVLLPPALLLLTIAVVGTGPPAGIGAPRPRRRSP